MTKHPLRLTAIRVMFRANRDLWLWLFFVISPSLRFNRFDVRPLRLRPPPNSFSQVPVFSHRFLCTILHCTLSFLTHIFSVFIRFSISFCILNSMKCRLYFVFFISINSRSRFQPKIPNLAYLLYLFKRK